MYQLVINRQLLTIEILNQLQIFNQMLPVLLPL